MVLKNRSNEIRTNEIRIRREPSVLLFSEAENSRKFQLLISEAENGWKFHKY